MNLVPHRKTLNTKPRSFVNKTPDLPATAFTDAKMDLKKNPISNHLIEQQNALTTNMCLAHLPQWVPLLWKDVEVLFCQFQRGQGLKS